MKPIVLQLDPEVRSKLEILAKAMGRNSSSLVAEAVEIFVNGEIDRLRRSTGDQQENTTYKRWKQKV